MKILVIGSGGREHALAWSFARSKRVSRVFVAPGNPGTQDEQGVENVDLGVSDFAGIVRFVRQQEVDLTVVGPEQPIAEGIRDYFDQCDLKCLAPSKLAAQLESSKSFAKDFMFRHEIPTAESLTTEDIGEASEYIKGKSMPIVVKADGLAAGKGVTVAQSESEAVETARTMLSGESFGEAGRRVVIEEFLNGEEASFTVLSDGEDVVPFASSQDHKAVYDADQGPNTGGMGAYSPAPVVSNAVHKSVMDSIVLPTIRGMAEDGIPFQGFLYVGLMIVEGAPFVIEFNCRFGDPEAQPVLMRLESDLAVQCLAAVDSGLAGRSLSFREESTVGVVLASGGYPGAYKTGYPIGGLDETDSNCKIFHAGTALQEDSVVTAGGRVLSVVGLGSTIGEAQKTAYARAELIEWPGVHMRRDIGYRAIARER